VKSTRQHFGTSTCNCRLLVVVTAMAIPKLFSVITLAAFVS
jgi:hypothetical protein